MIGSNQCLPSIPNQKRGQMDDIMSDPSGAGHPIGSDQLHELRNRLTVVKGVAQLLDRQVRRDDWQRDKIVSRVGRLQDEIETLQRLIDDFDSEDADGATDGRAGQVH